MPLPDDGNERSQAHLKILILHALGPVAERFAGVEDVELLFPKYDQKNEYLVHDAALPLPAIVADYPFHAAILTSTFLDKVKYLSFGSPAMRQWNFLLRKELVTVALPQDDYWLSSARDRFYRDYQINHVFPVCPKPTWKELYPRYFEVSRRSMHQGYTTYVTPRVLSLRQFSQPWTNRRLDVVYRASGRPTVPNELGYLKADIGARFLQAQTGAKSLVTDISTAPQRLIKGDAWFRFLGGSKAILGTPSGSSINVRDMQTMASLTLETGRRPGLPPSEIASLCLPEADRLRSYTALSPRNIEAAFIGTLQILVPGDYGGLLVESEDYVPLAQDCSNIGDVLRVIEDEEKALGIIDSCRQKILSFRPIGYKYHIKKVITEIRASLHETEESPYPFSLLKEKYERRLLLSKSKHYPLTKIKSAARHVKQFLVERKANNGN